MLYKSSTIVLFSFAACLFAARCGGGESGAVGGKDPLGENTTTTVHNYKVATNDGGTEYYSSSWTGENKVVNGVSYPVGIMEDPSTAEKDGIEVWANLTEESVEFAGGKVYWNSGGVAPPGEPFVSGALDQPVVIALSPTVGEPQELKVKGSAVMGDPSDPSNPHAIDTTVTFTLVDDQASVETEIGTVHDCKYFKASATVLGINLNADVRYNKQMGIVNANVNWPPPNGIKLDLTSLTDAGGAKEGYNVVKAVSVLGPSTPPFKLDTYDSHNAFDADKNSHAKMLLELRWIDETKAKTSEKPYVKIEFGTVWGIFGFDLFSSPLSFFHPEENEKGYTFWIAYVDQAAKNEPENGIAYHISVKPSEFSPLAGDVRVTARIVYKLYQP